MNIWLRQHGLSLLRTVRELATSPLTSLLSVLVIGVAITLPLAGYVLLASLQAFTGSISADPQISVFLTPDAGRSDAARIEARLRQDPKVHSIQYVSKQDALAQLKRRPGLAEIVATLPDNPLPDAVVITLSQPDATRAQALQKELEQMPKVTHVQADWAWMRRLDSALRFGRTSVALLAALLGFGLVAAMFSTIRLQILTQSGEIEVCKLIGATDAYIRRPFLYLGALYGAIGGAVASGIVSLSTLVLNRDLAGLTDLLGGELVLRRLEAADGLTVVLFAALLGWMGAYLSVSRHL